MAGRKLITEKNLGNGTSLLILAGIVARFPSEISQSLFTYTSDQLFTYIAFVAVALAVIMGVIYISEAQRNIPINYARRVRGNKQYGGVSTWPADAGEQCWRDPHHLRAFAPALPGHHRQLLRRIACHYRGKGRHARQPLPAEPAVLRHLLFPARGALHLLLYRGHLRSQIHRGEYPKAGRVCAGHPWPGPATAQFLNHLLNRVTLVGALFLGLIAVLPNIVRGFTGITSFTVGGTSILIVVSVALEVMKQIDAQLSMYEY